LEKSKGDVKDMSRGEATREKLLAETARLVRRQGFSRTSVNTVLDAAGIKKGALYHHFPGKDELGLAVLTRDRDDFLAFLNAVLDPAAPLASLDRFFTAAFQKHRGTGFVGGCLWGNTALEMSDSDTPHVEIVKQMFDDWIARIERVICAGQEVKEIRMDLPANKLACMVVAGVEGGIMLSRLTKKEGPLKTCIESLRAMLAPQSKPANPRIRKAARSAP
jgi:TetR/AcrR family transcriptional regulator, transcriptional repressor for nem operon